MRRPVSTLVLTLLLATGSPCLRAQPPVPSDLPALRDVPMTLRTPYDPSADATAAAEAALERARTSGRRVLLECGASWCPDCIALANILRVPAIERFVRQHFEVVLVDVGRFDKNGALLARFGVTERLQGIPAVLIVDADAKLVNAGHLSALADARSMEPSAVVKWLAQWVP